MDFVSDRSQGHRILGQSGQAVVAQTKHVKGVLKHPCIQVRNGTEGPLGPFEASNKLGEVVLHPTIASPSAAEDEG